ncbi:MAG: hypothetical protein ACI87W_001077 [Halieaceae bacterium]|jgi:hypothetical protein
MSTLRVAMWSGPRNISTAMMRAFENRADCAVVDEPFYAAYLHMTGIDHPGREQILASQPQDWREVAAQLCESGPAAVYYQKHMTQHLLPDMDMSFTTSMRNCFLIREPRRIIASYARIRPQFSLAELGFTQQRELFERERDRLGRVPPVLDAALTLENPQAVLEQLCTVLGIPFDESMLSWPPGARDSDGVWAPHWYNAVWESTGFAAPAVDTTALQKNSGQSSAAVAPGPALTEEQERLCEHAELIYEEMRSHALSA